MTSVAGARVLEIERSLGDPWDADNTASLVSLADGLTAPDVAGAVLDELDLDADFVPVACGGRLSRLDQLGRVSRHVLGRDADLALSGGMNSLPASASLWMSGTQDQQRRAAKTLLRRRTIRFIGLDTDGRATVCADRVGAAIRVHGTADLLAAAAPAELLVVHAGDARGPGEPAAVSTLLLLDSVRRTGEHPVDALIGEWGHGCDVEGRRQALTTSVSASALVGLGDTALRVGVRAVGGTHGPSPRWLGDCFADLLVADALASVACRSVHLLPSECEALAAASRWQAAQLIGEILYRVALHDPVVPSATAAPLAKLVQDFTTMTRRLPWVEPAHLVIGRRLAHLVAAPGGTDRPPAFDRLYDLAAGLPDLGPAPRVDSAYGSPGGDVGWLHLGDADDVALHTALDHRDLFHEQFRLLTREVQRQRAAAGTGVRRSSPDPDDLVAPARRYSLLLAATASIRVWAAAGRRSPGTAPALSADSASAADVTDEAWLLVGLDRLLHRLGVTGPAVPADVHARLTAEALRRIRKPRSLDLYADRMSG